MHKHTFMLSAYTHMYVYWSWRQTSTGTSHFQSYYRKPYRLKETIEFVNAEVYW